MGKSIARNWTIVGAGVAACAACCVPLLLPLFATVGGASAAGALTGGMFGKTWAEIACLAAVGGLVAASAFMLWRTWSKRKRPAANDCACELVAKGASCKVGGGCDTIG